MQLYKQTGIFLIAYYFFGTVIFLCLFGLANSFDMLISSPVSQDLNGTTILFSATIASVLVMFLMRKRLLLQPYPYFKLGFYIGNVSLLFLFLISHLLSNDMVWTFPKFLLIFVVPFVELVFAYLFGLAFIALIPAWLSAYILFKVIQHKDKQ